MIRWTRVYRLFLAVLGLAFLSGLTYFAQLYMQTRLLGLGFASATATVSPAEVAYVVTAILFGLIASHIFQQASTAPDGTFHIGHAIRQMPANGRFWSALVVSPLVFEAVLIEVGDSKLTLAHYLLAFQNGFFWETVIGRRPPADRGPLPAEDLPSSTNRTA